MSVSPARDCAYAVVRRVFEDAAWADRALHAASTRRRLDPRDRALAVQLAYGTVQRAATLDHVIERIAARSAADIDAPALAALRLGAFQLCMLDRIPAHAAVGESVELVKRDAPRAAGFVNAVLRKTATSGRKLLEEMSARSPQEAALVYSHPEWVAELWWNLLGPDEARALMESGNRSAEASIRVNTLRADRAELAGKLGLPFHAPDDPPEALVLEEGWDAFSSPEWSAGQFMPQSRAAMSVAHVLAPQPGERVLDLCAAPGGKTTHLAALMESRGEIVAVERHKGRAEALVRTAERMGASCVEVRTGDAASFEDPAGFDRVLVDPPCSDLGTLASRPDARWRKSAADAERLSRLQRSILDAGARALKPGGTLVYCTCTISPQENEQLVDAFLSENGAFAADDLRSDLPVWQHPRVPLYAQTLPHRDGTEGFFIARLRREGGS